MPTKLLHTHNHIGTIHILRQHQMGEGVGQMLIFADEGGRGGIGVMKSWKMDP